MTKEDLLVILEELLPVDTDLGIAWAYVAAGCEFSLVNGVLEISHPNFNTFEVGEGNVWSEFKLPPRVEEREDVSSPKKFKYYTPEGVKKNYKRSELIEICKKAVVPVDKWRNRDTPDAQSKVGECLAKLLRLDTFSIITEGDYFATDDRTIWLEIDDESYYLPAEKRLEEANGGDWY